MIMHIFGIILNHVPHEAIDNAHLHLESARHGWRNWQKHVHGLGVLVTSELWLILMLQHSIAKSSCLQPSVPRAPKSITFIEMLQINHIVWPSLVLAFSWPGVAVQELEPDFTIEFTHNPCCSPTTTAPGESPRYRGLPHRASSNEMRQCLCAKYWSHKFELNIPWWPICHFAWPDPSCSGTTPKRWVKLRLPWAPEESFSELEFM
jgi:hypothetical protein